ncbi:MAG: Ig-like domain-containing protein [Paludibacteraceae bacterium]|nr:Ig-like domain-containing protein [Paludibacteraceae bacterium]
MSVKTTISSPASKLPKLSFIIAAAVSAIAITEGCANRGIGPQGGPKDETPPKIVKEVPANGSVNYKENNIQIFFDEYIQLDKVSENVLVSPPQQRPPEVKAIGKHVMVKFDGELLDSTTYTIDFGSAICDNNEKNPIANYSFAFSTGNEIDSLQIGGRMLNAADLNPISGIIVGIHSDLSDTALSTVAFNRISKTDASGKFLIKNIHKGSYRLYGLRDMSSDYVYQPGESLAMLNDTITPYCFRDLQTDTIWRDSISTRISDGERLRDTISVIDTIITHEKTFYRPDSVVLYFFEEDKTRQYFIRALREQRNSISLYFNAEQDSLPQFFPAGGTDSSWINSALLQSNEKHDTLTLWITDTAAIATDTLQFAMRYFKTDSIYQLQEQTDTIRALYRAPRNNAKNKKNDEQKQQFIDIKTNASNTYDFYRTLQIQLPTPLDSFETDNIHLYQLVDTTQVAKNFKIEKGNDVGTLLNLIYAWEPQTEYALLIDSAALHDIYGLCNNKTTARLKTRSTDEYSTLNIKLEPLVENAIIQILNDKDAVVREQKAENGSARFEYLKPESYYLRMYIDLNGDGKWTTGDFLTHRQPEPVYYFPSKLTLRANWEFEESWNIYAIPMADSKPEALRKDAAAKKK